MARKKLSSDDNGGGEEGAEEKALKTDCNSRDVELRDEPEDQFKGYREWEVDLGIQISFLDVYSLRLGDSNIQAGTNLQQ